jgi:hypothetical protein
VFPFRHHNDLRRKQTAPLRLCHRRFTTRTHNTTRTGICTPKKRRRRSRSRRRLHGVVEEGDFGVWLVGFACYGFEGFLPSTAAEEEEDCEGQEDKGGG